MSTKHSWPLLVMGFLVLGGTAKAASTLYAATSLGPFKSTDRGVTWTQLTVTSKDSSLAGVPKILAMVVDPQTQSTVYAMGRFGTPLAFLKSTDAGANWSVVSKPTFSFTFGDGGLLAIDPVRTTVLYAMNASSGAESQGLGALPDQFGVRLHVRFLQRFPWAAHSRGEREYRPPFPRRHGR